MDPTYFLHAAPVAFLGLLASYVYHRLPGSKSVTTPSLRITALTALGLSILALSTFIHHQVKASPSHRTSSPWSPSAYVPTYLPPLTAPYALNLTCAQSDGTKGTCSPSFCATQAPSAVNTAACIATQTTATDPANYLTTKVKCSTCTVSTDARCTTAALTAQFGGVSSVYAAFCNAGYLVIVSSTDNSFPQNLDNIVYPPGGTNTDGSSCRTRAASIGATGMQVKRVTLSPVQLPTASLSNNLANGVFTSTWNYINGSFFYPLPVSGAIGFTIAGQDMFPMFNNRGTTTPEQCESDGCNAHVGQGGGEPHLHGDPFGAPGWCLYSASNYSSVTAHPPVIGYSIDGYIIYGRHLSTTAVGWASNPLDICGGHSHDSYGYHYHTQVLSATTDAFAAPGVTAGQPYPASTTGVYQCFRGDLSADKSLNAQGPTVTASNPCCGATNYYVKPCFSLTGLGSNGATATCSSTGSSTSTGTTSASSTSSNSNTLALGLGLGVGLGVVALAALIVYFVFCWGGSQLKSKAVSAGGSVVVSGGGGGGGAAAAAAAANKSGGKEHKKKNPVAGNSV